MGGIALGITSLSKYVEKKTLVCGGGNALGITSLSKYVEKKTLVCGGGNALGITSLSKYVEKKTLVCLEIEFLSTEQTPSGGGALRGNTNGFAPFGLPPPLASAPCGCRPYILLKRKSRKRKVLAEPTDFDVSTSENVFFYVIYFLEFPKLKNCMYFNLTFFSQKMFFGSLFFTNENFDRAIAIRFSARRAENFFFSIDLSYVLSSFWVAPIYC